MHKEVASDGSVHYYPKPAANVLKMFARMTGTRRQAIVALAGSRTRNLGAFAASDENSASIVVFNYNSALVFRNNDNSLPDTPETFTLGLNNLPFGGDVTIQRYQVDAANGNLKAFLDNPDQHRTQTCKWSSPRAASRTDG